MLRRLRVLVVQYWWAVVAGWLLLAIVLRAVAPRWSDIAYDGDFAYLPNRMPSVAGQQLLDSAFPEDRAKSQVVIILARQDAWQQADLKMSYDYLRRCQNLAGAIALDRARQLAGQLGAEHLPGDVDDDPMAAVKSDLVMAGEDQQAWSQFKNTLEAARTALDDAVRLDKLLHEYWVDRAREQPADAHLKPRRLAEAYHNRAQLFDLLAQPEPAQQDRAKALEYGGTVDDAQSTVLLPVGVEKLPIVDLWSWHTQHFGSKLISSDQRARLIVLQISNEFMATGNLHLLSFLEDYFEEAREQVSAAAPGLNVGISGSAVVGGDLMRCAAESIRHTEWFTVLLVLLILTVIYRSPLLVAVPLITIGVSLVVGMSLVALLTQVGDWMDWPWWQFKVFTTTRIFVVVILFGAGTDYCLFLISRFRERLAAGEDTSTASKSALRDVGEALAASALTTILGLSMMVFAEFGKFRYSGPVIGLCLAVTLAACLTLVPALLCAFGSWIFWPSRDLAIREAAPWSRSLWHRVARATVRRPGWVLCAGLLVMLPLAGYGYLRGGQVTYDFLQELSPERSSRRSAALMKQYFPVGESGPLTVLIQREAGQLATDDGQYKIRRLSDDLRLSGVTAIRSSQDPLGELQPREWPSIATERGWKLHAMRRDWRTRAIFLAQAKAWTGRVARLELILQDDPFSLSAVSTVDAIERKLKQITSNPESYWYGSKFAFAGTSAAIRDLRAVTQRDNRLIQGLVVVAVFVVLAIILRKPIVCLYMMATVLLSYYVTLGITQCFFAWLYADTFHGLDWKVPLFLFVILVAIGQDYNVYLATRVMEEQRQWGPFSGLRRAVVITGGIISSCGLIMAGTFFTMTAGGWLHWLPNGTPQGVLRGMIELGFALSLGVLLDTFFVRPVLLPAFFALQARRQLARWLGRTSQTSQV